MLLTSKRFLHHIVTFLATDLVYKIYHKQLVYPFKNNCANEVSVLVRTCNVTKIPSTLSRDSWKTYVKKQVTVKAFKTLKAKAKNNSKINNIKYEINLKGQPYIILLEPNLSKVAFQAILGMTDIKQSYKINIKIHSEECVTTKRWELTTCDRLCHL